MHGVCLQCAKLLSLWTHHQVIQRFRDVAWRKGSPYAGPCCPLHCYLSCRFFLKMHHQTFRRHDARAMLSRRLDLPSPSPPTRSSSPPASASCVKGGAAAFVETESGRKGSKNTVVKPEVKPEVKPGVKPGVKPEVSPEVDPEVKPVNPPPAGETEPTKPVVEEGETLPATPTPKSPSEPGGGTQVLKRPAGGSKVPKGMKRPARAEPPAPMVEEEARDVDQQAEEAKKDGELPPEEPKPAGRGLKRPSASRAVECEKEKLPTERKYFEPAAGGDGLVSDENGWKAWRISCCMGLRTCCQTFSA